MYVFGNDVLDVIVNFPDVKIVMFSENNQSVIDYKAGKDRALGFLVGQAMKLTKGKANPQMLNKMFIEEINKM